MSDQFYIFQSESTGNTKYFEIQEEITYAKQIFRRNFAGIIEVTSELYTSRGFLFGVRVMDSEKIENSWNERGKKKISESRILSEILRYSISGKFPVALGEDAHCLF